MNTAALAFESDRMYNRGASPGQTVRLREAWRNVRLHPQQLVYPEQRGGPDLTALDAQVTDAAAIVVAAGTATGSVCVWLVPGEYRATSVEETSGSDDDGTLPQVCGVRANCSGMFSTAISHLQLDLTGTRLVAVDASGAVATWIVSPTGQAIHEHLVDRQTMCVRGDKPACACRREIRPRVVQLTVATTSGKIFTRQVTRGSETSSESRDAQFAHDGVEVVFVGFVRAHDGSSHLCSVDRAGLVEVWSNDTRCCLPVTRIRLELGTILYERDNASHRTELFNRQVVRCQSHQWAVAQSIHYFLSTACTEVDVSHLRTGESPRAFAPRSGRDSRKVLEASFDNDGIVATVVAYKCHRSATHAHVLSAVVDSPALRVLEFRSGTPRDGVTTLCFGDSLVVHTSTIMPDGTVRRHRKLEHRIESARDVDTRLDDCSIATVSAGDDARCLALRLGAVTYVYGLADGCGLVKKISTPCPSVGRCLLRASGATLVSTTPFGLAIVDVRAALDAMPGNDRHSAPAPTSNAPEVTLAESTPPLTL